MINNHKSQFIFISAIGTFRRVKVDTRRKKGVFLGVAENIVGLLLFRGVGIVQCLFNLLYMSFGDCTRAQHQETTVKREPSHLE